MQRRLTDDERKQVQQVCGGLEDLDVYVSGRLELIEKLLAMLKHNTTDGLPYVDPPLTDEDARARPWVMVRQELQREWKGPCILVCVTKERYSFTTAAPDLSETNTWQECRLATPAEIAAAGLEVAE
jgi:hypothetical protein